VNLRIDTHERIAAAVARHGQFPKLDGQFFVRQVIDSNVSNGSHLRFLTIRGGAPLRLY
jgi:hypothetical protein